MDISNFNKASSLVGQLRELEKKIELVSAGTALGITIQSTYQKDDFVDAMRPTVLAELNKLKDHIVTELAGVGVVVKPNLITE